MVTSPNIGVHTVEGLTEKPRGYYGKARCTLSRFIREGPNRVLDVGCGEGRTGALLKASGKADRVVGIEKNAAAARIAEDTIDHVICADAEGLELPFAPGYFDYIIMGDVLEHLRNPWAALASLAVCLKVGGHIVASVPNVRYWRVVIPLVLRGEWRYTAQGVLDDTHLRFFTKKSLMRLFRSESLVVDRMTPEFKLLPKSKSNRFNRFTWGLFEDFLAMGYIFEVSKR